MLSSLKRVFIFLFIITIIFVLGSYYYSKGHTYYNNDNESGNTAGNVYNGGFFCQKGDTIYFSNDYDHGSLYSMNTVCENIKKISTDSAIYINADSHYIYYVKSDSNVENNSSSMRFNNGGLYRLNTSGTSLKCITANPTSYLMLSGNYLYYQQYSVDDGMNMARTKLDGTDSRTLSHSSTIPFSVSDNNLYYYGTAKNQPIMEMLLTSFTEHTKYNAAYQYPIFFDNYVYYINPANKNRIYRMKKDGSAPTLLINETCSTYNITNSGQYLYYQIGDGKSNRIGRLNLDTMKKETILKGSYKNIYVTDNYVFFNNYEHSKIFKVIADGGREVSELIPSK